MKTRTGCLFEKNGFYYCKVVINGKSIRRKLSDEEGNEIPVGTKTNLEKAERAKDKWTAPFRLGDEVMSLGAIKQKLESAKLAVDDAQNPPLKLSDLWNRYEKSARRPQSGERTLAGYESQFKRFSKWVADNHPTIALARDVTDNIADQFAQWMIAEKLSPSTYNQYLISLKRLWLVLEKDIKGNSNPWNGINRMPAEMEERRRNALTSAEYQKLVTEIVDDEDYRDLMIALANTGQRLVDMVHLQWQSILQTTIRILPRKTSRWKARDTHGKAVWIPILPEMQELITRRRRAKSLDSKYVFPKLVGLYDRDNGSAMSKTIGRYFKKAGLSLRKEGFAGRAVVEHGAHSFRHLFVTKAIEAGLSFDDISLITGHKSEEMIKHYDHADMRKKIEALAAKLGSKSKYKNDNRKIEAWTVKELAEKMNSKNWKDIKSELLELAQSAGN